MTSEARRLVEAAAVVIVVVVLVLLVHVRSGNERAICDGDPCELGSGASWLVTGAAVAGPIAGSVGVAWTRRLHRRDDLGPTAHRRVPDIEEIAEVLFVLSAAGIAYLLVRNGPTVPIVEANWPNSWLEGRLGRDGRNWLVPARLTWFLVGFVLAAPFAFAAGTAIGREWYGRRPARSDQLGDD